MRHDETEDDVYIHAAMGSIITQLGVMHENLGGADFRPHPQDLHPVAVTFCSRTVDVLTQVYFATVVSLFVQPYWQCMRTRAWHQ